MLNFVRVVFSAFLYFSSIFLPLSNFSDFARYYTEEEGDFSLFIVHVNDVHAHISEYTQLGQICHPDLPTPDDEECIAGLPRLETKVSEVLKERDLSLWNQVDRDQFLFLNAGDEFQGTLYFNIYQGNASAQFMNIFEYDAFVLGNHEFDSGPAVLAQYIEKLKTPVLCANLDSSKEPSFDNVKNLFPYRIVEKKGQKIAIIGVIVQDIASLSSPGPLLSFSDPKAAMEQYIKQLREDENVDKVVALTHIGYDEDMELASEVDGIDVIVGGHSHTYLGPGGSGKYPTIVKNPSGNDVCIVQAKCWATYLGTLDVVWDAEGNIKSCQGEPIYMDSSIPKNETMEQQVLGISGPVIDLMKKPAGSSKNSLPQDMCRSEECALGNVISDAVVKAARKYEDDVIGGIVNGGGLRTGLPKGDVSWGSILACLPFGNRINVAKVPGSTIYDMFEHSFASLPNGSGRFLQVSADFRVRYDLRSNKTRVASVEFKPTLEGEWETLDREQKYKVAMSSFVFSGGDGYDMVEPVAEDVVELGSTTIADAAQEYFVEDSPITTGLESRVASVEEKQKQGPFVNLMFYLVFGCFVGASVVIGAAVGVMALMERRRRRREWEQQIAKNPLLSDEEYRVGY